MRLCLLMLPLCTLFAPVLFADYAGAYSSSVVTSARAGLADVKCSAEFDATWGQGTAEAGEKFVKDYGPFPQVTATGETTTGADGKFRLSVSVKVSGEGKLPTGNIRVGNRNVQAPYVTVKITFTKEGYRTASTTAWVCDGQEPDSSTMYTLVRTYSYQATLVHMADRTPVANAKVLVMGWRSQSSVASSGSRRGKSSTGTGEPQEVLTDAAGVLRLDDTQCPTDEMRLLMLEDGLAFSSVSTVWSGIKLREGANDGGTLVVGPGGSIKARAVHAETEADLPVVYSIWSSDPKAPFAFTIGGGASECTIRGIPEGTYTLGVQPGESFWFASVEAVSVVASQETNVGTLRIEPYQTIEVFAVTGEGSGVQAFTVVAEQLSGTRFDILGRRKDPETARRAWQVYVQCTAEKNKVERLARGRWRVTVTADGYSPGSVEVDVPATDPIFVKVEQGGELQISLDKKDFQWGGDFSKIIAISTGAPAWKLLSVKSGVEIVQLASTAQGAGVFISEDSWRDPDSFKALPPDTYLVVACLNPETAIRADNVVVKKGEVTSLVLGKSLAQLTVQVMDGASPLAKELIYLVPGQSWDGQESLKTVSATSDANGSVVFKDVPASTYEVMTKRQYEWVNSGPDGRWGATRTLPEGATPKIKFGFGDRIELEVDVAQPFYVWVSVKLTKPKTVYAHEVRLMNLRGMTVLNSISPVANGDVYEFGMLPKGSYEFSLQVLIGGKGGYKLLRAFEVDQPPQQQFDVDLKLGSIDVKTTAPKGFSAQEVTVYLHYVHALDWNSYSTPGAGGKVDAKGSIKFEDVPEGPYRVIAWAQKERGGFVYICSEDIDLSGSKKVTLKFDERVGALALNLESSGRGSFGTDFEKSLNIELLNGDVPAIQGDPRTVYRQASQITLSAIAKGKYTLRISGAGFEPYTQENVEINTGATTSVDINLVPTCHVHVRLIGPQVPAASLLGGSVEYLDASGTAIDVGNVDVPQTYRAGSGGGFDNGASWLSFDHVPQKCARIRFTATGYKQLTIDVKPERDKTNQTEATIEAE